MTIHWTDFIVVVGVSLFSACLIVFVFSLALRLGGGVAAWRRPVSIALFVLCGLFALYGIYLIVPALHK